ncbi:MAG TPA: hypothetical protein VKR43_03630 [Bryobacteraceae bacterium]|nr:hypothetical protein [Bryobacteraceae bacterium]
MPRTRIEKFYPLADRFKVAFERLVECDLGDPAGEFPDIRAEVRQELHAIESDVERAGYTLDEVRDYVVAEEERRASVESESGRSAHPKD